MNIVAADVASLLDDYDQTARRFDAAVADYESAALMSTRAASDYAEAEAAYKAAERNWRWMAYIVVAAATWDFAGTICDGVESTQQYRRRTGLVGNQTICVDHSFPHALGGINHRWNYAPLDCRTNSSYGASFWPKFQVMPLEMARGLVISAIARLRCGAKTSAWQR